MTFKDLQPGQLARIPRIHARPGELAPVVRVEADMHPCTDGLCACLITFGREIETGHLNPYHRPADFAVVAITPAA
ncbi:hypothetical protein ITP53_16735 [Nonomuraea sp. K274]|uniref:Uncharacterized protein n=1 Tax=Nonomuraea cypriaca TaxID=1187855 RepID=A0A931AC16_9ACTN|nr:hypothetical protein [Nonomuraea cypriaca]MBF8187349.1 hypothetical protein [Nonomuraea cypriaca]